MGNRAVITDNKQRIGIYLHWNGGRDSVEAFLKYCELRQFRTDDYGMARLIQVITNYMGGGLSVGVGPLDELDTDNYDNGTYVIDNWKIIDRLHFEGSEQNAYDFIKLLHKINNAQPKADRLEKEVIDNVQVPLF